MNNSPSRSFSRRKLIASSIIGTGSALVPKSAVASSSDPTEDNLKDWSSGFSESVTVEDGKATVSQDFSAQLSTHTSKYSSRDFVDDINKGIQAGYWEPIDRNGNIWLKLTKKGSRTLKKAASDVSGGISIQNHEGCGETKKAGDAVYFSDEATEELVWELRKVGTVMAVAGAILGIVGGFAVGPGGAVPGGVLVIAGGLVNLGASYVSGKNEGCGIIVISADDIKPQLCPCNGHGDGEDEPEPPACNPQSGGCIQGTGQ